MVFYIVSFTACWSGIQQAFFMFPTSKNSAKIVLKHSKTPAKKIVYLGCFRQMTLGPFAFFVSSFEKMGRKVFWEISQLKDNGFLKTTDQVGTFLKGTDLYYRHVKGDKYIVINHLRKVGKLGVESLDCWLAWYELESDIGKEKALKVEDIVMGFKYPEDWHLVEHHLKE